MMSSLFNAINIMVPLKKEKKPERKPNIIETLIDEPEKFRLVAEIEGDEIVIKISKKEEQ